MSTKAKFQAIRGTRDLLPPETALWNRVEKTAHEVFSTFGFGEIRVPIFEETELFARAVGDDTDIVAKEMYTFEDRPPDVEKPHLMGDYDGYLSTVKKLLENGSLPRTHTNLHAIAQFEQFWTVFNETRTDVDSLLKASYYAREIELGLDLALRPEATASVCRAYIEHNMQQLPQPVKLYYMGPMFRRERPQKGRYRQFYQIGAEILGGPDAPAIDAELIEMLMTFFGKLGLEGTTLDINSIGHAADNCRRGYVAKLKAELEKVKDKLGADSQRRIETNPLRVLDSKLEHEQPIIATLPRIADHLCDDCKTHYAAVKRELDLRGVKYRENWRLVRGLDYYMRTTFEITAPGLGSQNAVCGGGRYDGLVELLGGPPTKGIGFAIGEDRLILS
ncbi:MAG: histidine--tRNA ligase, partial [Candidatus Acidiferrum sp.]